MSLQFELTAFESGAFWAAEAYVATACEESNDSRAASFIEPTRACEPLDRVLDPPSPCATFESGHLLLGY